MNNRLTFTPAEWEAIERIIRTDRASQFALSSLGLDLSAAHERGQVVVHVLGTGLPAVQFGVGYLMGLYNGVVRGKV